MDVTQLSALEMSALLDSGELTSQEITKAVLDIIETNGKKYNAFITVTGESAIKQAIAADRRIGRGERLSLLDGIPVAVKDNICTKGIRTTCASKMLDSYIPPYDASVTEYLKGAGAVIVGKTNMDEFAMGASSDTSYYGAVHNPWDTDRTPGGSSGGSAAAVAARLVPVALGTDTGGSVRQPSAMCGVCGMKSTYGAVSRYGLIAYANSFDQIGVLAQNAADCATLLNIISQKDSRDSTYTGLDGGFSSMLKMPIEGKKVGIPQDCLEGNIDGDVKTAFLSAVDVMRSLGCEIEYFPFPLLKYVIPCYYTVSNAEVSTNMSRFDGVKYGYRTAEYGSVTDMIIKSRSEGFGAEVKKRIMLGTFALTAENYERYYKKAIETKKLLSAAFDECYKKYDVLMCPTVPASAGLIGVSETDIDRMYLADVYTVSANISGLPAISVPCGFSKSGMPIGFQFMGKRYGDASVLGFASAYQGVTDWHKAAPKEAKVCTRR